MERVKDSQIKAWVARMQRQGMDIGLDGAYNRFAITNKSGSVTLSPRAPNRHILDWLDTYDKGYRAGLETGAARVVDELRHGREIVGES